MKFCVSCGTENDDNATFCIKCGYNFDGKSETSTKEITIKFIKQCEHLKICK